MVWLPCLQIPCTVSASGHIENLQNHKTIFENQNSHIPRTHSQASWTLETYISQTCTSQMYTHGGVYLVDVHLTYTGVPLVHKRVPYGRASHVCVSDRRVSHERVSHGRVSEGRVSYGRVS